MVLQGVLLNKCSVSLGKQSKQEANLWQIHASNQKTSTTKAKFRLPKIGKKDKDNSELQTCMYATV